MTKTPAPDYRSELSALTIMRKQAKKERKRRGVLTAAERKITKRITELKRACNRAACVLIELHGEEEAKDAIKTCGAKLSTVTRWLRLGLWKVKPSDFNVNNRRMPQESEDTLAQWLIQQAERLALISTEGSHRKSLFLIERVGL